MKKNIYLIIVFSLGALLTSCSNGDELSDAYGNFEAKEVVISAETPGQLRQLNVTEGERVDAGQILAVVDTSDFVLKKQQLEKQASATTAKLASLQAQKAVFEQQLTNLQKDLDRIKSMKKDGAATQKQLDDIEGAIAVTQRQAESVDAQRAAIIKSVETIKVQIREVDHNINKAVISSPIDGSILTLFVESGELMGPGRAMMKIADLTEMKLKVYVSGKQLSGLKLGQSVEVIVDNDEGGLKSLSGKLSWISDEAEFTPKIIQTREERVNMVYAVEVLVPNDGSLKIGMPGEVNFTSSNN